MATNSYRIDYNKIPIDYSKIPLTFEIIGDGNIVWTTLNDPPFRTIEYSLNGGNWTEITPTTEGTSINVNSGDIVEFRGNNTSYGSSQVKYNTFSGSTAQFKVYGNIMSMINSTDFSELTTLTSNNNYAFTGLFGDCHGLTDASNLILPATTLANSCYAYMFYGCTSLTTAPELPATTLTEYCYNRMFVGCTSLTTAPELPATTLVEYCYENMFRYCLSLNYIKCLATNLGYFYNTYDWVSSVASSGTFVKNPSMTSWTTGGNGIPNGWTVVDA